MDNAISFRVIYDDSSSVEWEDPIVVDGVEKLASIDDIDRTKAAQLLTLNSLREPIHVLTFTPEERKTRLMVWRRYAGKSQTGEDITIGALAGYNDIKEGLKIDLVMPDGTVVSGEGQDIQLHPREVFSDAQRQEIIAEQERQNALTEEDNQLLVNQNGSDS